jgi:DNA-3-methyladenine glycosylase I
MSAEYCAMAPSHPFHGPYHDGEYGFPARQDGVLFERLVLEINQAGLSWLTVLKKRAAFTAAYAGWDLDRVAGFGARDITRLLGDPGIIRNRLKIEATIENARRIVALRERHGSFADWLDEHHPRSKPDWVRLFRDTFRFTGGEIVGEFLMSVGYLPGAHVGDCPVHARVLRLGPPWTKAAQPQVIPEKTAPILGKKRGQRKK